MARDRRTDRVSARAKQGVQAFEAALEDFTEKA
jgi:hypothetical protein